MSFHDAISAATANILNTLGEPCKLYVRGSGWSPDPLLRTGGTDITAIWDEDDLAGGNSNTSYNGKPMSDKDGRSNRQVIILEMDASVAISEVQDDRAPDIVVNLLVGSPQYGKSVRIQRIVSRDHAMKTVAGIIHHTVKRITGSYSR